jgi:hypothetical protein
MPRKRKLRPMEKISLAITHLDDGALHTAADLLLEAATEIKGIASKRSAMMDRLVGKAVAKPAK